MTSTSSPPAARWAATLAEQGVALIGSREIRDLMRSGPVGRTA